MLARIRKVISARADEGASAVEYGLLVAAIAAVVVVIVFALGGVVKEVFSDTCNAIESGVGSAALSAECSPAPAPGAPAN